MPSPQGADLKTQPAGDAMWEAMREGAKQEGGMDGGRSVL